MWAEKAQERSRSAAQKVASGTSTREGSSGAQDGGRKTTTGEGVSAAAGEAAGAGMSQVVQTTAQQHVAADDGHNLDEMLKFLKQGVYCW